MVRGLEEIFLKMDPWVMAAVIIGAVVFLLVVASGVVVAMRGLRAGVVMLGELLGLVKPRVYFGRELMSASEAAFFKVLREASGAEFLVMTKVRLADLVEVKATGKEWGRAFNRVCRKHVDFVVIDARDFRVRVVVELDDRSHEREDRRKRDVMVDAVLKEAGVRIVHVKVAERYRVGEVAGWVRG